MNSFEMNDMLILGKFQQYDYGLIGNLERYKQLSPPEYDIGKINVSVTIFHSKNDWLSSDKVSSLKLLNFKYASGVFPPFLF